MPDIAELVAMVSRIMAGCDDPYPEYAHLREHAPRLSLPSGARFMTRHHDVSEILRDPRCGHLYLERQRELWGEAQLASSRLLQSRLKWFLFMETTETGQRFVE